jgi:hypothetical protein
MAFWEFTVCMYCVLSSGDLARYVMANQLLHLPMNGAVRSAFFIVTTPAMVGVIALPVYGFVIMPWWQPIAGIVVASILGNVLTRSMLVGSSWLYMWSMGFSVAGALLFAYFIA